MTARFSPFRRAPSTIFREAMTEGLLAPTDYNPWRNRRHAFRWRVRACAPIPTNISSRVIASLGLFHYFDMNIQAVRQIVRT
jgi:hypothetical protein